MRWPLRTKLSRPRRGGGIKEKFLEAEGPRQNVDGVEIAKGKRDVQGGGHGICNDREESHLASVFGFS